MLHVLQHSLILFFSFLFVFETSCFKNYILMYHRRLHMFEKIEKDTEIKYVSIKEAKIFNADFL